MTLAIPFTKMQGAGNDYVYVNGFATHVDDPATLAPVISDRHFGVGADGLILVLPPLDAGVADLRMRMFNADGSEAQMCGNGLRCVCKFARERGLAVGNPMRVETGGGVLSVAYDLDAGGAVTQVTVDMGPPRLAAGVVPVRLPGIGPAERVIDTTLPVDATAYPMSCEPGGIDPRMTCVSMGNPHAVFYCRDVAAIDLAVFGRRLETDPIFPQRVNVHVVQVHARDHVTMRSWERGSGATLACGTGASAVCVAGVLTGRTDGELRVGVPGGELELRWDGGETPVLMSGPAVEVFEGVWR